MTNTLYECINCSKYGGLEFNRLRSGPFEGVYLYSLAFIRPLEMTAL